MFICLTDQVLKENEARMYQVDAFTSNVFKGNPAAVVIIPKEYPSDEKLQKIAAENNLSETAFVSFGINQDDNRYSLRWFTPLREVDCCGHATLASAHILYSEYHVDKKSEIEFETNKSGILKVSRISRKGETPRYLMDFPSQKYKKELVTEKEREIFRKSFVKEYESLPSGGGGILGEVLGDLYWLIEFESKKMVLECSPVFEELIKVGRGVCVTSKDDDDDNEKKYDFVSRFFAPWYGVNEDPVTGSAHTLLSSYWFDKNEGKKRKFLAKQVSKRTGEIGVEYLGERTLISGEAVTFLKGRMKF